MTAQAAYADARHVREQAGWCKLQSIGLLRFEGEDAARFLHGQLSQDIKSLQEGRGFWLALLDRKAKVQADMRLYRWDNGYTALLDVAQIPKVLALLEGVHFSEKITFTNLTSEYTLFSLQGKDAPRFLPNIASRIPEMNPHDTIVSSIVETPCRVISESVTGTTGYWLLIDQNDQSTVQTALQAFGDATGATEYDEATTGDILRIEAGIPKYGVDFDDTRLLPELAQEEMICYTKGCYVGQEIVARIQTYGHVNRQLAGLSLGGGMPAPAPGTPIVSPEGKAIGTITSAANSKRLGHPIALASLQHTFVEIGTQVFTQSNGERTKAIVSSLPFIK